MEPCNRIEGLVKKLLSILAHASRSHHRLEDVINEEYLPGETIQQLIDLILDLLGVPEDNVLELLKENRCASLCDLPEEAGEKLFCRDWLYDYFYTNTLNTSLDELYNGLLEVINKGCE